MRRSNFIRRAVRHPQDGLKAKLIRLSKRAAFGVFVLWIGAWLLLSGTVDKAREWGRGEVVTAFASIGFKVQNIFVEGRENMDADLIKALVNMDKNAPIFSFDPMTVQAMLQTVPWVKTAHVERRLPDTIYIRLQERAPFALWSNAGKLALVASDGTVLSQTNLARYKDLPMIAGAQAPQNAGALMELLRAQPTVKSRMESASWVGDRRWDLRFENGTIVKLPEEDTALALSRLVDAHAQDKLMDMPLETIDLREETRIVVKARGEKDLRTLTSAPVAVAREM